MEPYQELELRFGEWIGNPNTVACSSGTAALHLALEALQLPMHSCVMVPEFTMVACARAVTMAGLHPIFIDCGDDLLLDTKIMRSKTVRHQSAIMPVHIYGRRCNMKTIIDHAKTNNLAVIEDMAEIHGVNPHPESDAACWSFYKNKIVHGEEGGMIAFKEAKHADKARQLRSLGFTSAHDFAHIPRGHNYRLANLLAEPILTSLAKVDSHLEWRRCQAQDCDSQLPQEWKMPARNVDWVYDLRIPGMRAEVQDKLISALNAKGVAARHGFKPMSSQREYRNGSYRHLNAHRLAQEVVYLPLHEDSNFQDAADSVNLLVETYHQLTEAKV